MPWKKSANPLIRLTYNSSMRSHLLRVAVVANALLLVLPPGWCQAVAAHCDIEKSVPAATCCHQIPLQDSESEQAPVSPGIKCCCSRDAVVDRETVQPPEDHGLSLLAVPSDSVTVSCPQAMGDISTRANLHAGPPLRILQCVWRC